MISWIKAIFGRFKKAQAEVAPVTIEPLGPESYPVKINPVPPVADRSGFYSVVRKKLGRLNLSQVDGFETLFQKWEEAKLTDLRWFAYMLATAWHETAFTMQPIREMGGEKYLKSKKYWPYYGRGYVQLTWKYNYERYKIDKDPDRALEPDLAAHIMIDGMVNGIFTSSALRDYFSKTKNNPVGARRIINGTDKAAEIARYHEIFLEGLNQVVVKTPA